MPSELDGGTQLLALDTDPGQATPALCGELIAVLAWKLRRSRMSFHAFTAILTAIFQLADNIFYRNTFA
jgi:hypothetical protein